MNQKIFENKWWRCRESNPGPNWNRVAFSTRLLLLSFRDSSGVAKTQSILILHNKFQLGRNGLKLPQFVDCLNSLATETKLGQADGICLTSQVRQPQRNYNRLLQFESRDLRAALSTLYVLTHLLANPSKARTPPYGLLAYSYSSVKEQPTKVRPRTPFLIIFLQNPPLIYQSKPLNS